MLLNLHDIIGPHVANQLSNKTCKYILLIDPDQHSYILNVYCERYSKEPILNLCKNKQYIILEYMISRRLYKTNKIIPKDDEVNPKDNCLLALVHIYDLVKIYQLLLKNYRKIDYSIYFLEGLMQICKYNSSKMLKELLTTYSNNDYFMNIIKKNYSNLCGLAIENGSGLVFTILSEYYYVPYKKSICPVKFEENLLITNIFTSITNYSYLNISHVAFQEHLRQYNLILDFYINVYKKNYDNFDEFFESECGVYLLIRLIAFNTSWEILKFIFTKYRLKHKITIDDDDIISGLCNVFGQSLYFKHNSISEYVFKHNLKKKINFYNKAIETHWKKYRSHKYTTNTHSINHNINSSDKPHENVNINISKDASKDVDKIGSMYIKFIKNISKNFHAHLIYPDKNNK
jgi:hypothetical protein